MATSANRLDWFIPAYLGVNVLCLPHSRVKEALNVLDKRSIPYEVNYPYRGDNDNCTLASPPERRVGGDFSFKRFNSSQITAVSGNRGIGTAVSGWAHN